MPKIPQNIYLAIAIIILVLGVIQISRGDGGIGIFYLIVGSFGLLSWHVRRKPR